MARLRGGSVYVVIGFIFSVSMMVALGGPYKAFSELILHLNLDIQEWRVHLLIAGFALIIWGSYKTLKQRA